MSAFDMNSLISGPRPSKKASWESCAVHLYLYAPPHLVSPYLCGAREHLDYSTLPYFSFMAGFRSDAFWIDQACTP